MNRRQAEKVARVIREYFADATVPADEWSLFGFKHHELRRGEYSLACEGYIDSWAATAADQLADKMKTEVGWWVSMEAQYGCLLYIRDLRRDKEYQ